MRNNRVYIFLLYLLLSEAALHAQDIAASNTNQHLLGLNPSFAGSNGGLRLQGNYLINQINRTGTRAFY